MLGLLRLLFCQFTQEEFGGSSTCEYTYAQVDKKKVIHRDVPTAKYIV